MFPYKLLLYVALTGMAESAKILIAIPFSGTSHYISNRNIGLELSRRGHEVYVITTITEKETPNKNYHEIVVDFITYWELMDCEPPNLSSMEYLDFINFISFLHESGVRHSEWTLNSTNVQSFLAENHKFDLVICEVFFYDTFYVLAHHYNAPLVLMTTFGNSFRTNYFIGNPLQLSTVLHEYGREMKPGSFWGRLKNLYYCMIEMTVLKFYYDKKYQDVAKKYLPNIREPVPSASEMTAKASLVLMNSHFSADGSAAYLPNVVEVGGLHINTSDTKLPQDLQSFMDSASDGVVLISFGTVLSSTDLPEDKMSALLRVFGRLKQKVLLKWGEEEMLGKPKNLEVRKWLPQKEILAHPNLRLFVAHGGLIGIQEATYYGVPILGIPFFGDQLNNVLQAKKLGYAEILEYEDINEERLEKSLKNMLENDDYKKRAKEVSDRFKDRPMPALDTAIYWIEYVIRHKGASFLRSPALEMNFFAYYMLDVQIVLALALIVFVIIVKKIVNAIGKTNKTKVEASKRKKQN